MAKVSGQFYSTSKFFLCQVPLHTKILLLFNLRLIFVSLSFNLRLVFVSLSFNLRLVFVSSLFFTCLYLILKKTLTLPPCVFYVAGNSHQGGEGELSLSFFFFPLLKANLFFSRADFSFTTMGGIIRGSPPYPLRFFSFLFPHFFQPLGRG